jgi:hypothetical protein
MVRVGVKRIEDGRPADLDGPAGLSVQQHWVEIDGVDLEVALRSVEWGPDETGGANICTVKFFVADFETVDCREPHGAQLIPEDPDDADPDDGVTEPGPEPTPTPTPTFSFDAATKEAWRRVVEVFAARTARL